jgi:hypothetical protein
MRANTSVNAGAVMVAVARAIGHPKILCGLLALLFPALPPVAIAQDWVWTTEVVDKSGRSMSLATDADGNVHMSYGSDEGLKYGFRPAGDKSRWFTMSLGGGVAYTSLSLDSHGDPHICSTYFSVGLRYAHYNNKQWEIQTIAPEDKSAQLACGVAISSDGTPHVSWYSIPSVEYAHIRYATLQDGVWLMRTLDFDVQTGKWHTLILDPGGNPCISYDAFVKGLMKVARWDGKEWSIRVVDSRAAHGSDYNLGMGSSLAFDSHGNAHVSYYSDTEIRHAWQDGQSWKVETVEKITPSGGASDYRSSIVFDKEGFPHISYEDRGIAKHAFWDGRQWHVQAIAPSGTSISRFSAMTIDQKHNVLYFAYRDAADGSVKVAAGRRNSEPSQTAMSEKKADKN